MRETEIAIVGAGLAGARAAPMLGRAGRAVTLDMVWLSGDAMLAGSRVDVAGSVGRDVYAKGQRVEVEAELQRDLVISGDDLYVGPSASIGRDLEAHVDDADDLDVAAGALIHGSTEVFDDLDDSRFDDIGFYTRKILMLVAGLVFGLVAFTLAPNMFQAPREQTEQQMVGDLVDRAFGGSASRLVMQALSSRPATVEELDRIRRLIDEIEGEKE